LENKTDAFHQEYLELRKKAVEPHKRHRIQTLDWERSMAKNKICSLFLESLVEKDTLFQQAFLKYGAHLSSFLDDLGSWDTRDAEQRIMDLQFSQEDTLFSFNNKKFTPITYAEVLQSFSQEPKAYAYILLKDKILEAFQESLLPSPA
jgi:hypothetical protein